MAGERIITPKPITTLLDRELISVPSWVEPAILPKRGLLLFGGDSKIGKSFIAIELGRALALAKRPFGCEHFSVPAPARVLYLEQEIGEWGLGKRAQSIFAEDDRSRLESNFFYVSQAPEIKLDTRIGKKLLREIIDDVQPNVLIMDPIAKMHSGDENSNTDIGKIFNELDKLRNEYRHNDMSIIVSHHARKPSSDPRAEEDLLSPHRYRGAARFYADPDTLVTITRTDTFRNSMGGKAWRVKTRWEARQGDTPDDMMFVVNAENDLRVTYEYTTGAPKKIEFTKTKKPKTNDEENEPVQLMFPT